MLLLMYQIFSSLRDHLHFSVQFSLHFHENFFLNSQYGRKISQINCIIFSFQQKLETNKIHHPKKSVKKKRVLAFPIQRIICCLCKPAPKRTTIPICCSVFTIFNQEHASETPVRHLFTIAAIRFPVRAARKLRSPWKPNLVCF